MPTSSGKGHRLSVAELRAKRAARKSVRIGEPAKAPEQAAAMPAVSRMSAAEIKRQRIATRKHTRRAAQLEKLAHAERARGMALLHPWDAIDELIDSGMPASMGLDEPTDPFVARKARKVKPATQEG